MLLRLYELGCRQREIVNGGDMTTLLELLATKQNMISLLQQVESELAPYHAEDPDARAWASTDDRTRCARQAAECNRLLEKIVELEKQSAQRLADRRNEVAVQLQRVYSAGQARQAYEASK